MGKDAWFATPKFFEKIRIMKEGNIPNINTKN
jgi:hypothetical protein